MATFRGGPRDGQLVEPEHAHAEEVRVVYTDYDEDLQALERVEHLYLPDAFGNFFYRGLCNS